MGRVGRDNVVREVVLPVGTMPDELAESPDGTIWFTEAGFAVVGGRHSGVGSYAPNGVIAEPVSFKPGHLLVESTRQTTEAYGFRLVKRTAPSARLRWRAK